MQRSSDNKPTFQRPWGQRASYVFMREVFRYSAMLAYGYRCYGRDNFPDEGGALICANHQSNLDPPLVGMNCNRRMNFLAKKSLFKKQPLRWMINHLDAIPLDREGLSLSGIKETMKRLRRGEIVLMFPEGERCWDGELAPLMPGFCTMARRTKVPLVPVGFDGAFQAWPRTTLIPKFGRVVLKVGPPIWPEVYQELSDDELIVLLHGEIEKCFEFAREKRRHMLKI